MLQRNRRRIVFISSESALHIPAEMIHYGMTKAEALVHQRMPRKALLGIGCHNDVVKKKLESLIAAAGRTLTVKTTPTWYFS